MKHETIAFFVPTLEGGGAEKNIIRIANTLSRVGRGVMLIVQNDRGPLKSEIAPEVQLFSLNRSRMIKTFLPLVNKLNEIRPECIVATLTQANLMLLIAARLLRYEPRIIIRVECVLSRMIDDEKKRHQLFYLAPSLVRYWFPKADRIIAISDGVQQDLIKSYGIRPEKIKTIYNPAIPEGITEQKSQPTDHPWLIHSEDIPVLISVGRLTHQKGFDLLIKSFSQVQKEHLCRLIILGEGPERTLLEELIKKLGLEEKVWMPGFVENPYKFLIKADLFVLSSRYEGFGNVLVEAMACGLPVIATDCPSGPAEILDQGTYGELVPVEDIDKLAESIRNRLSEMPAKPVDYGAWLQQFEVPEVTERYLSVINYGV